MPLSGSIPELPHVAKASEIEMRNKSNPGGWILESTLRGRLILINIARPGTEKSFTTDSS